MARSKETFNKKDVQNKKAKKRKEKEKRKLERKEQGKQSMDDMIAYVDENGMIVDTPPDMSEKTEVSIDDIEIGVPKKEDREEVAEVFGKVSRFDDAKGYGFIHESNSQNSIFFHVSDCLDDIKVGDKVIYDVEKGPKGLKAVQVKLKTQ